ncbi:hypothetical protein D1871_14510 [Nakamurella silvestris]|nr:hypothetical protein D1871_14510 [Nakamurella silvestris]
MDLNPYIEALRTDLAVAARAGGSEATELAERLLAPLDAAVRLTILDVLAAAAGEITLDLAPGSVDLRLRGREPSFVVTLPATPDGSTGGSERPDTRAAPEAPRGSADDEGSMTRINLRLAEDLKARVEDAARGAGISVNAWLVRAATSALVTDQGGYRPAEPHRRSAGGGERYAGWVR